MMLLRPFISTLIITGRVNIQGSGTKRKFSTETDRIDLSLPPMFAAVVINKDFYNNVYEGGKFLRKFLRDGDASFY